MRLAKFLFLVSPVVALTCLTSAEEKGLPLPDREAKDIHICHGGRAEQLGELVRQLSVSSFVDLGRAWGDEEDAAPESRRYFTFWKPFDFNGGTVSKALDAFCKDRAFQWRYWKEARAVWIEPKEAGKQAAAFYLQRAFVKPIGHDPEHNHYFGDPQGALYGDTMGLEDAWKATRRLPNEAGCYFQVSVRERCATPFGNFRNVGEAVLLGETESIKSLLEFVQRFLVTDPPRSVFLQVVTHKDDAASSGTLYLGSLDPAFNVLPLDRVLAGLLPGGSKTPDGYRACLMETYRRYRAAPAEFLKALKKCGLVEKCSALQLEQIAIEMNQWDSLAFGRFFIEAFEEGDRATKLKIIERCILLQNGDLFLEFWKKLSGSQDKDFRERGMQALEWYKNQ